MKFSIHNLAEEIIDDFNGDVDDYKGRKYVFDDTVAFVTGRVQAEFKILYFDYMTPPEYKLLDRWADITEVELDNRILTNDELDELEGLLRL